MKAKMPEQREQDRALCRIVVPFDVARLSSNQRLHWAERNRRVAVARRLAEIAWVQAGCPEAAGPVRVSLVVRRARRLDQDNALSGAKSLIDSLFNNAITPDDSDRWVILGGIRQETGAGWRGREEVEFVVEDENSG